MLERVVEEEAGETDDAEGDERVASRMEEDGVRGRVE